MNLFADVAAKPYVMYKSLGNWYITTRENYNSWIQNARTITNLGPDYEEAKAIVAYNWHGLDDVEIIMQ